MKKVIHKSDSRGRANYGWLQTYYSFSFAQYYNPERVNFGALRVLNDDVIEGGMGFDMHPHDNMEIITIPLEGELAHRDSMGHSSVISSGEVQVMSAGTGIRHSEFNNIPDKVVKLLQIWVIPNQVNVKPRYDQRKLNVEDRSNRFQQIISPNADDEGSWIHQDAWFSLTNLDKGLELDYRIKKSGNGLYLFVIDGSFVIDGIDLGKRDGLGIWEVDQINVKSNAEHSELLLMEVPMNIY